ncbi:MAG: hypothetical protein ACH350_06310 [Parachlamydiaceae bacterium]
MIHSPDTLLVRKVSDEYYAKINMLMLNKTSFFCRLLSHLFLFFTLFGFFLIWDRMTTGSWTIKHSLWLFSLMMNALLMGDLLLKWIFCDEERFNNLPTKCLLGFLSCNMFLFIAVLILPFTLKINWILVSLFLPCLWCYIRKGDVSTLSSNVHHSEIFFFFVIPLAITAWCQDLLQPLIFEDGAATVKVWPDYYFHLCEINSFSLSHGLNTMCDPQMSGAAIHPYHLASYVIPAAMVSATGTSSLVAYASLFVPLGMLLASFGAYALGNTMFGPWGALAGCIALTMLPDAYQQGFGNHFLSFHWLEQISPAMGYALGSASLVFVLLLNGCENNQWRFILWGYAFTFITLLFKAHIFVALSLIALIYPFIFMTGSVMKYRIPLLILLICGYVGVVILFQEHPGVPKMRLDGSGFTYYSQLILNFQQDGLIRKGVIESLHLFESSWFLQALIFSFMLLMGTCGLAIIIYPTLLNCRQPSMWLFPLLVIVIYLIMSCGLSPDDRRIGQPEELLHRPFVWAYFVLMIWCGGAVYYNLFGYQLPQSKQIKRLFCLIIMLLQMIPLHYGKNIEAFPEWGMNGEKIPFGLFQTAHFIQEHSHPDDIVQDSENDPRFILSALCMRKPFIINGGGFRAPKGSLGRLNAMKILHELQSEDQIEAFMQRYAIKWYVVGPSQDATHILSKAPIFECEDYKVYHYQ